MTISLYPQVDTEPTTRRIKLKAFNVHNNNRRSRVTATLTRHRYNDIQGRKRRERGEFRNKREGEEINILCLLFHHLEKVATHEGMS